MTGQFLVTLKEGILVLNPIDAEGVSLVPALVSAGFTKSDGVVGAVTMDLQPEPINLRGK